MKDFYRQKGDRTRKLYQTKTQVSHFKVTFFEGMAGVHQEDYLTSADQVVSG